MIFKTVSGSEYEISHSVLSGEKLVRRVNAGSSKRADGVWLRLINKPVIRVGQRAVLMTESLAPYGYDQPSSSAGSAASTRITTEVSEVLDV